MKFGMAAAPEVISDTGTDPGRYRSRPEAFRSCHEIQAGVVRMAYEYAAYGQLRVPNERRNVGILVSGDDLAGVGRNPILRLYFTATDDFGGQ